MNCQYSHGPEWTAYQELMRKRPESFSQSDQIFIVYDAEAVDQFVADTGKKVGVVYSSPYHYLIVDLIRGENGNLYTYERVLPAVESGAVVALTMLNNQFVLLKQYRHAIRTIQYGFPRGFGEKQLSAEQNVKKEVQEELGANVIQCKFLGEVVADSGFLGNHVSVFFCEIDGIEKHYNYEGIEDVVTLSEEEMKQWIKEGKITDGFSLAAYSMWQSGKKS